MQLGLSCRKFKVRVFQLFGHCPLQGLLFWLSGSPTGAQHLGGGAHQTGAADRQVSCPFSLSPHCTAGRAVAPGAACVEIRLECEHLPGQPSADI